MLRPYITSAELPRQAREQNIHVPPPDYHRRMVSIPAKPFPHFPRRIGVVRDQGAELVHEQPPGVRLHDWPDTLERPIATERADEQQDGGSGACDGDRSTGENEQKGEIP